MKTARYEEARDTELGDYETWEPAVDARRARLEAFGENVACFIAGFLLALAFVWAMP